MSSRPKRGVKWISLDPVSSVWERCFVVSSLVVVGTREPDGDPDFAPKHLAGPLSWEGHYGFVCTPAHATYRNARREGWFTVSFPRPSQVLVASLTAAPRCDDGSKPALSALATRPAREVGGWLLEDAYLALECTLDRVVDGFGANSLVAGRIVAAEVAEDSMRLRERDDRDLVARSPLLAYLQPGRFAHIEESFAFPFHEGFTR
jgi:flavin reductase (DIM6/NTAB) family NADH-FMN oxidoreductase RutF